MSVIIKVENLIKKYKNREILKNISFEINEGEFVSIIGESGAGKTTLMRCINGIESIESGNIFLLEKNLQKIKDSEKKFLSQKTSFIFQELNIIDNLFVIENVMLPFLANKNFIQILFNHFSKEEYERAEYCIEKVGLSDFTYTKAKYLSGGERQRAAIARALATNAKIIFGDEPISSLDEKNAKQIMEIFKKISLKKGKTIILNLHNVEFAKKYSTKILALKKGEIFFFKKSEEVTDDDIRKVYQNSEN